MSESFTPVRWFLALTATTVCLVVAFNFVIDPLQLFRPATFYRPLYASDTRMQDAGLIRSQEFDTAFMGTSLAVHYRQSEIDTALGVKSLKLAMTGSTSVEQSFVLAAALQRHPKNVIWEMDDWIFRESPTIDENQFLRADLYRMNIKGIAGYLFSLDTAREAFFIVLRYLKPMKEVLHALAAAQYLKFYNDQVNEINTLPPYLDLSSIYNSEKARASFAHYAKFPAEIMASYDYDTMVRNFERDAISLIGDNPNTNFRVFFPPYSVLQTVAMRDFDPKALQTFYRVSAYILERLVQYPNVKVYDFRDANEITHDLTNYADVVHHSPVVDRKILSLMAVESHLVTREAPTASIERLKRQVERYQ
jgi:hypothetical protein